MFCSVLYCILISEGMVVVLWKVGSRGIIFSALFLFVFPLGFGWAGWDGKDGNYYTHYELCLSFRYVLSIARGKKFSVEDRVSDGSAGRKLIRWPTLGQTPESCKTSQTTSLRSQPQPQPPEPSRDPTHQTQSRKKYANIVETVEAHELLCRNRVLCSNRQVSLGL